MSHQEKVSVINMIDKNQKTLKFFEEVLVQLTLIEMGVIESVDAYDTIHELLVGIHFSSVIV